MRQGHLDKTGHPLIPGDLIVYGASVGQVVTLRYGRVVELTMGSNGQPDYKFPKIRVRAVDMNDDFDDDKRCVPKLLSRDVHLAFSARVLRLTKEQVPADVLELLDSMKTVDLEKN